MEKRKKTEPAPEILTMYHLKPAPPSYELQRYIELYCAEKDSRYFSWYLHSYEPVLNKTIRTAAERYGVLNHFEDLKAEAVLGILEALGKYDIGSGVPFLAFQKSFIQDVMENYIRINREGIITMTKDTYPVLKKIMALFYSGGERTGNDSICRIADAMGMGVQTVRSYLTIGLLNEHREDLYRRLNEDADGDAEAEPAEDGSAADEMYFRGVAECAVREAYRKLSYRERRMVAQRLAFCSECLSTEEVQGDETVSMEKQSFFDIALSHGLASAEAAENAYHGALQKLRAVVEQDAEFSRVFGKSSFNR